MTPTDLDLGLAQHYTPPPLLQCQPHLPTPPHHYTHITSHHNNHLSPHTPSPSPITVTEAGDLVRNMDDGSSTEYSHSEVSFISQPAPIPDQRNIPFSSPTVQRVEWDTPPLHQTSHYRTRDMRLSLSRFHDTPMRTPVPSCSCSCHHSRDSTPTATSPLLDSPRQPAHRHKHMTSFSPLHLTPPLQAQHRHHYRLWVNRGHTHSPPTDQLPYILARDRRGRLESPV